MQPQYKQSAPHQAQRGTSLIEILVVLVILVVGILSIVRLFPAGFIALRNAENNTFADRLAQGALEQLKKSGNGLPDAIYMYSTADGFIPTYATLTPTDFDKTYTPIGGTVADAAYNDINKQRYIKDETITVPAPHVVGSTSYPPLYAVNYGPIYLPKEYATLTLPAVSVRYLPINSLPWTPQVGDSRTDVSDVRANQSNLSSSIDNPVDVLQSGQQKYLVDAAAGKIAVPPAQYPQTFTLLVQTNVSMLPLPLTIKVPASNDAAAPYVGDWFDPTASPYLQPDPATGVTPTGAALPMAPWTSQAMARPFLYKGIYAPGTSTNPSKTFGADPYEFALNATNMGANTNTGVIAFNPLAAGQNGSQPLKARISYMTLDWHILHEDQNIAEGSPSIRLTLNHLKKIGDTQFDQTLYNGLIPDGTTPADIVMLNLDTGAVTNLAAPQNGANGGVTFNDDDNTGTADGKPLDTQYIVSYQNGRITFPKDSPAQHLRFYYAGDADWALAIQKAPSVYVHSINPMTGLDDPAPLAQTSKQKLMGMVSTTPTPNLYSTDAANLRVQFPVCDAGKTIEFDGISYTDTKGNQKTIGQGTGTITDASKTDPVYVYLGTGGLNSSSILTDADGTKPITFQAVRGVSARATVIWHERNHWRTRSIDTLLTQTQ